jgi:hypothetical protein
MTLSINGLNFEESVNELFTKYGVTQDQILDFNKTPTGYDFEVNKTVDSEVKMNADVDNLIKSNKFKSTDVAFICSDNKVHTPKGSTLFERIKELRESNLVPIVGFSNFIDASNDFNNITDSLKNGTPVVYGDHVLTKEGQELKGSLITNARQSTEDQHIPVIIVNILPTGLGNLTPDAVIQGIDLVENTNRGIIATIYNDTPGLSVAVLFSRITMFEMYGADPDYKFNFKSVAR